MKISNRFAIAAILALAATSALAQDASLYNTPTPTSSAKMSRLIVVASINPAEQHLTSVLAPTPRPDSEALNPAAVVVYTDASAPAETPVVADPIPATVVLPDVVPVPTPRPVASAPAKVPTPTKRPNRDHVEGKVGLLDGFFGGVRKVINHGRVMCSDTVTTECEEGPAPSHS